MSKDEVKDNPEVEIVDEAEHDETVPYVSYDVTSYGSDPEVEVLVQRLRRNDILIPTFQRAYVWSQIEASRFIESLLLGLPVPGVFFAAEPETNKHLVIDGQQRLKSLQFFYDGVFDPKLDEKKHKVFRLTRVQQQFEGKTYLDLAEKDRTRLNTAIIHATVVKQTSPEGDDTSLYYIFERLNSGGKRLTAQEMRIAIYHGKLMEKIRELNNFESWRKIFGKYNARLKDQELILRYFALCGELKKYNRPMENFLNKFSSQNRHFDAVNLKDLPNRFKVCCQLFEDALGKEAFRPTRALNVAVFDSCMVGLSRRLEREEKIDIANIGKEYKALLADSEYNKACTRSTSDEVNVKLRIERAIAAFSKV